MIQMPKPGQHVDVHDPLGYSGRGTITAVMVHPHHAVLVRMETITDRVDQSTVGKEVWVLTGCVSPVQEERLLCGRPRRYFSQQTCTLPRGHAGQHEDETHLWDNESW